MGILGLLMVLHAVVIGGFVMARALHARLSPMAAPALDLGVTGTLVGVGPQVPPSGRQLEEYMESGLADLRIMLVQAARRRHE